MFEESITVIAYTDASYWHTDKVGAWAVHIKSGKSHSRFSGICPPHYTNPMLCELYAAYKALNLILSIHISVDSIEIVTDNKYVSDNLLNGGKSKNKIIFALQEATKYLVRDTKVKLTFTKSHSGTEMNEMSDSLAKKTLINYVNDKQKKTRQM